MTVQVVELKVPVVVELIGSEATPLENDFCCTPLRLSDPEQVQVTFNPRITLEGEQLACAVGLVRSMTKSRD